MAAEQAVVQGEQPAEEQRCTHCGSSRTSNRWRSDAATGQRLCNACGQYADKHGGQLPPDSVLQRRPAQPRQLGTKEEIAQRRCLQCGSTSPGGGKRACWHRHPATGEEWVCGTCCSRAFRQLNKRLQQQAKVHGAAQQQTGNSGGPASVEGGQAPTPQLHLPSRKRRQEQPGQEAQVPSRKRRQEQPGQEAQVPAAFHDNPAPASKRRAEDTQQPEGDSGGEMPGEQLAAQQHMAAVAPAGRSGEAPQPAANRQRRQRRKQAQPQHLPPELLPQPQPEQSLAPTVLVEAEEEPAAGSVGPGAASLRGGAVAMWDAGGAVAMWEAAAAAAAAAAGTAVDAAVAAAGQGDQQGEAEPDLFDLLQQAMEVAAAAASGLTPELVAAFAMLLPLADKKEALLRRLLQRHQYSAAAAAMQVALRAAGHLPPLGT